jgi:uncharacterized protein YjbI with pentapeptide repeats
MECNFGGAQLANSDFSGGVLIGANFAGASLAWSSFRGSKLVAANFEGADLRDVAFDGVECTACNFQGAKLDEATFSGARMTAANFSGFRAAIAGDQLRALLARCAACNFQSAALSGFDLSGGSLAGVDFAKADLRRTRFDGAVLCWYVLDGAKRSIKCDNLQGARVEGASFKGVRICTDPEDAHTCTTVSADALRQFSGAALEGAALR